MVLVIIMSLLSVNAQSNEKSENTVPAAAEMLEKGEFAPGEIIVSMKTGASGIHKEATPETIFEGVDTRNIQKLTFHPSVDRAPYPNISDTKNISFKEDKYRDIYLLTLNNETDMEEALDKLNKRADVEVAEPNYIATPDATYDPLSVYQWSLDKIGVGAAWDKGFTGKSAVHVGILDTGIDYSHEDLVGNVNLSLAWDFYLNTSNVSDINGHGTFIAGIIGADVNGVGVVGVNRNVTMVPLKISFNSSGQAYVSTMVAAVNYAATNDEFSVLNLSYSLSSTSINLEMAVESFDGLFVSASGNDGLNIDLYPNGHCNDVENWIVVGASTSTDGIRSTSNYGATYVDLFAPGSSLYSTKLSNIYGTGSGTSYAAPQVVAAAAVIMAHATHLTPLEVRDLLFDTVDYCTAFNNKCVTDGRLSLINAVNYLYNEVRPAYSKGDVNGSGTITSADALLVQRIYLGTYTPTPQQFDAADVNNSGTVTSADYLMVQRYFYQTYYFPPY